MRLHTKNAVQLKSKLRPGSVRLGIDLGATKVLLGLIDGQGRVLAERRLATREILAHEPSVRRQPKAFAKALASSIVELVGEQALQDQSLRIQSWGLASAGPLNVARRELLSPANFPGWGRVPIAKLIEDAFERRLAEGSSKVPSQEKLARAAQRPLARLLKTPLAFQNDAVAAAIAEARVGLAKGTETSITLTLGTGLGTGVILNGLPAQSNGLGCEWGHLIVDCHGLNPRRPQLPDRGSVRLKPRERLKLATAEGYISGSGLVLRARQMGLELSRAGDLPELERSGDSKRVRQMARRLREDASAALSAVLWSLSLGFHPQVIILTGGIVEARVIDLKRAIATYQSHLKLFAPEFIAPVRISKLGGRAGLIGASFLD
jgi:glucokinase